MLAGGPEFDPQHPLKSQAQQHVHWIDRPRSLAVCPASLDEWVSTRFKKDLSNKRKEEKREGKGRENKRKEGKERIR